MSNREQLPNWAGRSVEAPNQARPTPLPGQQQPSMPPRGREPLAPREGRQPTPGPGQGHIPQQQQPGQQAPGLVAQQQRQPQPLQQHQGALPHQQPKKGGRTALIVLSAIALFILFGAGGYYVGTLDRGETTSDDAALTSSTTALDSSTTVAATEGAETGSDSTAALANDEMADDALSDDGMSDDANSDGAVADDANSAVDEDSQVVTVPADVTPDTDNGSGLTADGVVTSRRAILRGGKVYLEGSMPTQEIADLAEAKAAAVVGPDNVIAQYVIDPSVPFDPSEKAPIYVEEVVLFEFNKSQIAEPFKPLLDLGITLMLQNPQGRLTVTTRTDAVGSEAANLKMATDRANAIKKYMVDKNVPESQIVLNPRGEEGASENDDELTASQQRRAEFLVEDILE